MRSVAVAAALVGCACEDGVEACGTSTRSVGDVTAGALNRASSDVTFSARIRAQVSPMAALAAPTAAPIRAPVVGITRGRRYRTPLDAMCCRLHGEMHPIPRCMKTQCFARLWGLHE